MIDGDFRSAVHEAVAKPWKVDVVVHMILQSEDEGMLQYAKSALRGVDVKGIRLSEVVQWCWEARGVHDRSLPGLAWAIAMRNRNPPYGNDLGVSFIDDNSWCCCETVNEKSTCIRMSRSDEFTSWMGVGKYGDDVEVYFEANRREWKTS